MTRPTRRSSTTSKRDGAAGRGPRALAFAMFTIAAAGCFTNPINRPPVITQLSQVGGPTAKGQPATFTAIGSDPDQDQLTWTWATRPGDCADRSDPGNWPGDRFGGESGAPATYVVSDSSLTTSGGYCVWVFATDRYGAVDVQNLPVTPADNPPTVTIQLVVDPGRPDPPPGPTYPAYSVFQLTASASDADEGDSASLKYTWLPDQMPPGAAGFVPCAGQSNVGDQEKVRCFTGDVPGTYVVSVAVSDGTKTVRATTPMLIVLGDAPPCIVKTSPDFLIGATNLLAPTIVGSVPPGSIEVKTIYDDGNPYPPVNNSKNPRFTWFVSKGSDPLQYQDNVDFQRFTPGDYYQIGDHVNVRLEVHDEANASLIDTTLATCLDADFCAAPTIPPGRPDCWLRVTWRFELTQPGEPASPPSP